MAQELILRDDILPILRSRERRLGKELSRAAKRMDEIRDIAQIATDEVSAIAGYSAFKVANTLSFAELIREAARARGLSATSDAAFEWLAQEYFGTISRITQSANSKIIREVDRARNR